MPPNEGAVTFACDVAIVSYNTDLYLHNLLVSLRDKLPASRVAAVHVWDNASSDSTPALLAAFAARAPWLRVHRAPANIHHGPALDRLLRRHCSAEWVLVLDADTEVRRDFGPLLPLRDDTRPAFVGQIHPQMPHLYAYLAHLLIHRPTYLGLPRFRNDGAPGDEYLSRDRARTVAVRAIPLVRLRGARRPGLVARSPHAIGNDAPVLRIRGGTSEVGACLGRTAGA